MNCCVEVKNIDFFCEEANVWAETRVFWVVTPCRLVNQLRMYVLLVTSPCMGDHNSCVLHVKAIKATVFGTECGYLNNLYVLIRSTTYRCSLRYSATGCSTSRPKCNISC
jgi:hypothetical protein